MNLFLLVILVLLCLAIVGLAISVLLPIFILVCVLLFCSGLFQTIGGIVSIVLVIVVWCLISVIRKKESYVSFQDEKLDYLHKKLISVFPEAKYVKVSGSNQSFTIDKRHIYICLKDEKGNYYDDNSLMHVLLHEYAHVLCDEFDTTKEHGKKFQGIFRDLMEKASKARIYDQNIPMIQNYCGYENV